MGKTFEQYFGKSGCDKIRERIEELISSKEGGFVFIYTAENNKCTDAYMNVCKKCVN
jgi:hypothetical protein